MALGSLEDTQEEELRAQMETNFFGAALLTQTLLPQIRQRRGIIINVSSIFGFVTWPLTSIYCASKYALEGLTQSLSQELKPFGVRVALLEPGSHPTALNDNLHWGSRSPIEDSIYRKETIGYRNLRNKLARRKKEKMSNVARAAVKVANSAAPSLRNPVEIGTKMVYLFSRLFPQSIGVDLMAWTARRSFRKALPKR
jgi:NAD(P)-dependent dehydrogenase (short-subunit alcohol dehydrogenase family)